MKKCILYLGLNDAETKKQVMETKHALEIVKYLLLDEYHLPGATVHVADGIYKHQDGHIVTENTIVIILLGIDEEVIINIIRDLKLIFNQECILKEVSNVEYTFV